MSALNPTQDCVRCGAPVGRQMDSGVCAACLLEAMLPEVEAVAHATVTQPWSADAGAVQRFGPYEVLEELGRGGMGVVYKARQPGLDRVVAIKMLLAGEFAEDGARQRLLREARFAARLSHPGIVTIHEVGEHAGRPYFTMECVPGRNLGQICQEGIPPVETSVRYVARLAEAVHHAHQQGVIHRDIKPANVLITPWDEPKLTDFGLTKSLVDPTRSLESAGSPNFMAPEQVDPGLGGTGTLTDVFGLGALLYFLLTGRPPAHGGSVAAILRSVVSCQPLHPTRLRPDLPRDLETLTLKCLEREPGRRYESAQAVAEELARWQRGEPILARTPGPAERLWKWTRRHPMVASLLALVMATVSMGLAATTWQWRRAERSAVLAQASELLSRRQAYVAGIMVASKAAVAGNWELVRSQLDRTRPAPGEADLRGWEWRYLWQISRVGGTLQFGDGSNLVSSIALLQDGRSVALGEVEGGFSIWDSETGTLLDRLSERINQIRHPTLPGGASVVCRVAAVPGTSLLAYTECRSTNEGLVHFYDVGLRETVRSVPIPGMPRHLAISPDGRWGACSLMLPGRHVEVFEVASGRVMARVPVELSLYSLGHTLAFSADGGAVSVEHMPTKRIRVVDWRTGSVRHDFPLGEAFPLSTAFSPDGRWLAVGEGFGRRQVRVWNLETGGMATEFPVSDSMALQFDALSRRLLVDRQVWSVPGFTFERELDGLAVGVRGLTFLPNGAGCLTSDPAGKVWRWNFMEPPVQRGERLMPHRPRGGDLCCGGRGVLAVTEAGTVYRAMSPQFEPEFLPQLGTNVLRVVELDGRNQVAVLRADGVLSIHSTGDFGEQERFSIGEGSVDAMFWVPQSGLLALGRSGDRLEFWDTGAHTRTWEVSRVPHRTLGPPTREGWVYQLRVDGTLDLYDPVRRRVVSRQLDHDNMTAAWFSGDGRWLVTTSPSSTPRLVETRTWKTVTRLEIRGGDLPFVAGFWPEGDRLAFSGPRIHDVMTGWEMMSLGSSVQVPVTVLVSEDGSFVLSADMIEPLTAIWWAPSWEGIRRAELNGSADR